MTNKFFQSFQAFGGRPFYLVVLLRGQLRPGASKDIENSQLFFFQVLAHVAGLLFGVDAGEVEQLSENFFDISAAGVIAFDQLLKFFQIVGPRTVQAVPCAQARFEPRP